MMRPVPEPKAFLTCHRTLNCHAGVLTHSGFQVVQGKSPGKSRNGAGHAAVWGGSRDLPPSPQDPRGLGTDKTPTSLPPGNPPTTESPAVSLMD